MFLAFGHISLRRWFRQGHCIRKQQEPLLNLQQGRLTKRNKGGEQQRWRETATKERRTMGREEETQCEMQTCVEGGKENKGNEIRSGEKREYVGGGGEKTEFCFS